MVKVDTLKKWIVKYSAVESSRVDPLFFSHKSGVEFFEINLIVSAIDVTGKASRIKVLLSE